MPELTDHLRLLGDPSRLRILHLLSHEPLTVAELQEVLQLSQSSVSGHLGKLKRSGYLHDNAEGSSHRYRVREDLGNTPSSCWIAVRKLSKDDPLVQEDRRALEDLRAKRDANWVDRVAGSLHREYAPGRSFEALCHVGFALANLGDCIDIGAGDGALMELIRPSCRSLTCVEPSASMIRAGNRRIEETGLEDVTFEKAVAQDLPFADNSKDTALFLQSLQYVDEPKAAITEAQRVLKPGGRLLIITLVSHDYSECSLYGHIHRGFSEENLCAWTSNMSEVQCLELAPEARPPRFTPLLLLATKAGPEG